MKSIWENKHERPSFETLNGNKKVDVLIIGGGITGLLCAHKLHEAGVEYALVEANEICSGITLNTTAKITSQHGLIYHKLIKMFGIEKARMYLQANEAALYEYEKMAADIDCDFAKKDSYVYSTDDLTYIEKELDALDKIGGPAYYSDSAELPFPIRGAIKFKNQAQFDPLKFLMNISKKLNIYENTMVRKIDKMTAFADYGSIKADAIIVASHFPFINKHGSYFLKMFQERSYVIAIDTSHDIGGMYIDGSGNGFSLRNHNDYLLIGGGSHRTGKQSSGWENLNEFAKANYPDSKITYNWAAQDCMTLDGVPYIGQYSKMTPGLYVATGFNKWGMTSSMAAAMILKDMITGEKNQYASVFSPSRTILRKQLYVNGFESTKNLLKPSTKRCSHLGCALEWNNNEHSWDCQCHGSRFNENGEILNDPAQRNLKM